MKRFLLLFFYSITNATAGLHNNDPSYCAYWIERLCEISYLEQLQEEHVPRILAKHGSDAALEYYITLREGIRKVMKGIEGDSK